MTGIEAGQQIMSETQKALDAAGLGLGRGLEKLNQLLEAERTSGDETYPDNQTQVKALDILLTLGDHYPGKKIKAEVSVGLADLLLAEVDGTTTGLPSARTTKGKGKVKKS
jgi:hypothetical protein